MDPATLIGLGFGFAAIVGANVMEGGNPASLLLFPPILLVFGGTIAAAVAGGTMADAKNAGLAIKRALTDKPSPPADLLPVVVKLAEKARREGLLSLEDSVRGVDDPFLERGVTLAVDGTDPEELRDILEAELYATRVTGRQASKFYTDMGAYAPTFGIIGTVMGLVHVLENLSQPEELGHLIAAAFIATLWGVLSANILWMPIGNRLRRLSDLEAARMELVIEGVMAIQSGSNPRIVAQKLQSLLPEAKRDAEQKAA